MRKLRTENFPFDLLAKATLVLREMAGHGLKGHPVIDQSMPFGDTCQKLRALVEAALDHIVS